MNITQLWLDIRKDDPCLYFMLHAVLALIVINIVIAIVKK